MLSTKDVYDRADKTLTTLFEECYNNGTLCTVYTQKRQEWIDERYQPVGGKSFKVIGNA